jgi:hypothetical protein
MDSSSKKIELVIKNANARIDDFRLEIALSETIRNLKQKLSESYPDNPPMSAQKLIFAGRLLQDDQNLQEILKQVCFFIQN